jgi:predicted dehydrogenase
MQFALLCNDPLANPVIDALIEHVDGNRLSCSVRLDSETVHPVLARQYGQSVEHWEDLLVAKDIDAVLVGGTDPLVLDGAKQLAAAGIPLLFVPQAAQGSTFAYELSLIRDDNHVALYPLLWHRFDAAVVELRSAISEGRLGRIQFLQLQRSLTRPSSNSPISQADVDTELLPDADMLRWLIGDYDQVTSLRSAATNEGVLMQSVVLAGRSLPEATWSIIPAEGPPQWKLTVRGEDGIGELTRSESSRSWVCEIEDQQTPGDERSTARSLLAAFAESVSDGQTDVPASHRTVSAEWCELVQCFETIDATHRSVARRRTIELHFEPMSERAIFKTQMTAIGCGLLVATFLLTLCFLGIASVVPLPDMVLIGMRTLVFAPLVVFLVAQVLLPLTRPSSSERKYSH